MNQEETDNLNTQIDNSEIEFVILKKSQQTKVQDITQQFCQTYKEELMPVLLKLFKKLGGERTLPNSFYETTNTQTPKLKTLQKKKKKLHANISDKYRCENPQQNISKQNSIIYKKDHTL